MHYLTADLSEVAEQNDVIYAENKKAKTLTIDDIGNADLSYFIDYIVRYAYQKGYGKISVKVKESQAVYFFQHGFQVEASIVAYYGLQDAFFLVYYLEDEYLVDELSNAQDDILEHALKHNEQPTKFPDSVNISTSVNNDVKASMTEHAVFTGRSTFCESNKIERTKFYARIGDKIIASAISLYNEQDKAVEFTEFTIDLDYDINPVIAYLLVHMENYYINISCETAYTIISARNLAINAICAEKNYEFGGRLINELLVNGDLRSLNTWFKRL